MTTEEPRPLPPPTLPTAPLTLPSAPTLHYSVCEEAKAAAIYLMLTITITLGSL